VLVAKIRPVGRFVLKRMDISSASVWDSSGIDIRTYWVPSKLRVEATASKKWLKYLSVQK
jgi:hypothetical protein